MKKTKRYILIALILTAVVIAAIILIVRRKYRKYILSDAAKTFLQVYSADGSELFYATDAAQVKANPNEEKDITYEEGTITTHDIMVPIKTIIWDDGQRKNFNEKAYIIKDTIIA